MPDMIYVDSSNVEQIGYDANSRELHVYFVDGGRYVYENVSQEVFDRFVNAPSKGSFLNREIKAMGFAFRKL
jgi:hypothetical protein